MRSEINSYRFKVISLQNDVHDSIKIDGYLLSDIIGEMNLDFSKSFEAYTHDNVNAEIQQYYIPYMKHVHGL